MTTSTVLQLQLHYNCYYNCPKLIIKSIITTTTALQLQQHYDCSCKFATAQN